MISTESADGRADGGRASFAEVLAAHRAEVYRFACHLTCDRAAADALYRKTLLKARDAFADLDGAANHRAWLFTIATSAYLRQRHRRHLNGSRGEEWMGQGRGTTVDGDRLDSHALVREVEAFTASLPRRQWVAVVQRTYLNRGYAEIAETLSCSEVAARANVYEALRAMRAHFGERM